MRKILIAAALLCVTTSANASWWEQHANGQAKKFENACNTLVNNGSNVENCKRLADLMRVPENASKRDWGHHNNAILVFAQQYPEQFNMVIPPLRKDAKKK